MIQKLMLYGIPFSLLISGGLFPIGVVIYWVTTNLFSLGQQFWVLRKYPPPPMSGGTKSGASEGPSLAETLFGRKPKPAKKAIPAAAAPKADNASAPRPGAKPVNPKRIP